MGMLSPTMQRQKLELFHFDIPYSTGAKSHFIANASQLFLLSQFKSTTVVLWIKKNYIFLRAVLYHLYGEVSNPIIITLVTGHQQAKSITQCFNQKITKKIFEEYIIYSIRVP